MKKILLFLISLQFSFVQYGQIIADHTVVDKYDDIPQYYLDLVKKMWVSYAGESHSEGTRAGLLALETLYPSYTVSIVESGTPEAYTTTNLRFSRATWGDVDHSSGWIYSYGEEDWFTSSTAINRTKAGITYCNTHSLTLSALGFGWCYDYDLGFEFSDYISATQEYVDYCATNGYATKIFFTTAPNDNFLSDGAAGYVRYTENKSIRDYVHADGTRILFDYADILSYNNDGTPKTVTWDGHTYPVITDANAFPTNESYHISEAGALRLAKAMWWMLARIAGWDGSSSVTPVTGITVTGAGGATTITTDNGTLQLTATVTPSDATNKTVTWSVVNGTGQATINSTGLVTAVANGTVTARATANDGSGVVGSLVITISNQIIPVTGITVTGAGGATTIATDNGTLQLTATVAPTNATNKTVTWSVVNGTGQATINSTGLVTAVSNGTVTARATANDGSGVVGSLVITISNQVILVTGITVAGDGGATTITTDNGTLQLTATIAPTNATNKTVTWSVVNGTGQATISSTGLVTAVANGTVTARATANDVSGVFGEMTITIGSQFVAVTGIIVTGLGGATTIETDDGTLQMIASITPSNATEKGVIWSLSSGSGHASISETGLITARSNGKVTIRATAIDGSNIYGELEIIISNQIVPISSIHVKVKNKSTNATTVDGVLQLETEILPTDATNQTVDWSVINKSGEAIVDNTGLLTGVSPGEVVATASATDGSGVIGELSVTIDLVESIKITYNRYELRVLVPNRLIPARASLHNLYGTHIRTKTIESNECIFDISELLPGIYIVSVFNSTVQDAAKIVIAY